MYSAYVVGCHKGAVPVVRSEAVDRKRTRLVGDSRWLVSDLSVLIS